MALESLNWGQLSLALMLPLGPRVFSGLVKETEGNQEPRGQCPASQVTEMVREEVLILHLIQ